MEGTSEPFKWERHPRGSRKEYLNQAFPHQNTVELYNGVVLPCYHKDRTSATHKLGHIGEKVKPQQNCLIDLSITTCHNLQVIYDRQQVLGQEVQGLRSQLLELELSKEIRALKREQQKGFDKLAGQITGILEVVTTSVKAVAEKAVKEAQRPKAEESQTLSIAEDLEIKIAEVKNLIERVEGLIPS